MKNWIRIIILLFLSTSIFAQPERWQQKVDYKMNIDFNTKKHQFSGTQHLVYTNNSPDELHHLYYHLYFNAFQPGSMMDVRSRTISDPDKRVGDRISKLKPSEIGFQKIESLKMNGKKLKYTVVGTILEVDLPEPIAPHSTVTLDMVFKAQVPVQIRRSGRDNAEGIDYSMSQWYPKLAEYDYQGWHADPYVGREFYGVWGDFDVTITLPSKYTIGASGYLQDRNKIGHGYQDVGKPDMAKKDGKTTWHFIAPNVHDFVWAADPDYVHKSIQTDQDVTLHFFYQNEGDNEKNWGEFMTIMQKAIPFMNKNFGKYPYKKYSFIQGGDGGMEYPMATLITGNRALNSLVGVGIHEWFHSWYQMVLGSNESNHPWMDEGFTSYAAAETMAYLKNSGFLGKTDKVEFPHMEAHWGYAYLVSSGLEEPMTTHGDHYETNAAYGLAAYNKGEVFLDQLEYIVGTDKFKKGMLNYFDTWKFKHPNPNDFIRVMEKTADMELDWYKEYFVQSTKSVDYGIKDVKKKRRKKTTIIFERKGLMPMPVDFVVTTKKGKKEYFTIPLQLMRSEKTSENGIKYTVLEDWAWTNPTYTAVIPIKFKKIEKIEIDPSHRLTDQDDTNNVYTK